MGSTIGDGMAAMAIAGGVVAYLYFRHQERQKRLEVIHRERLVAMEKGIPLPELPLEQVRDKPQSDGNVIAILGMVLLSLSLGSMIVLYLNIRGETHGLWIAPLPFAFLGVGFIALHYLKDTSGR